MSKSRPVTGEDRDLIAQLLARYCWAFDAGDSDAYVALWTQDGVLSGFGEPSVGHEALKAAVVQSYEQLGGKTRHHLHNVVMEYDDGKADQVTVRGYNLVTKWGDAPALFAMVEQTFRLRHSGEWKLFAANLSFVQ